MSDKIAPARSDVDSYKNPMFDLKADGTITRNDSIFPTTVATPDPDEHMIVLSKDVPLNQSNNTWVRIYLPRQALDSSISTKLAVIVHFHGGGFVALSAATSMFHDLCFNITAEIPAVIVSVEYRLAPEHRLPAAYDDAVEALHWIKISQEEWLQKYADLSCCFLMGGSSGGNIAYHAALRATEQVDNLLPLKIRGLILISPYFGGVERTESELKMLDDPVIPLHISDLMWELSLPLGVDRDHEYCNPTMGAGPKLLEKFKLLGWKVMVTGGFGDPLLDRQIELLKLMEQNGVKLESHFDDSGHRMEDYNDPARPRALYVYIKNLVWSLIAAAY